MLACSSGSMTPSSMPAHVVGRRGGAGHRLVDGRAGVVGVRDVDAAHESCVLSGSAD